MTILFVLPGAYTNTLFGAEGFSEYDVKAVFVLNFPNFITWPPKADHSEKTICVFGADAIADSIELLLASPKMDKRKANIIFLREPDIDEHCDLLFIGQRASDKIVKKGLPIKSTHTLTVSDIPESASNGGMIELALAEEKIQVIMNWKAIKSNGFVADSRLLELATVIHSSDLQASK